MPPLHHGPLPATVNFNGTIRANAPCTVRYTWVRSDGGASPTHTLHFAGPGSQAVSTSRTFPANFTGWMAIRVISPAVVESNRADFRVHAGGGGPPPPLTEDLVPFRWDRAEVRRIGPFWMVVDGATQIVSSGNMAEANRALAIIRHYRMTAQGFVERPNPVMTYFLSSGAAPTGPFPGEDATAFNPALLEVRHVGGSWQLRTPTTAFFSFPTEDQARRALAIIRRYGFTHICYVGRPGPCMTYFRR